MQQINGELLDSLLATYRLAVEQSHPISGYILKMFREYGVLPKNSGSNSEKSLDKDGACATIKAVQDRTDADDDGHWITTENNHNVHINGEGVPDKGNPHVLNAMSQETPNAEESAAAGRATIKVNGPKQTKAFIDKYFSQHPEVKADVEKYKDVMDKVANFQRDHPDAEDGTYSATTGERVEVTGYCVTFHQNLTASEPYGGYSSDDYAAMCAISKHELGSEDVYIGYFGNAEVSFSCQDREKALNFAIEHNQHSVYDSSADYEDALILNPHYDPDTNPIENH